MEEDPDEDEKRSTTSNLSMFKKKLEELSKQHQKRLEIVKDPESDKPKEEFEVRLFKRSIEFKALEKAV